MFTIAHLSDSHLSDEKAYFGPNFEAIADHLRRAAPDLVVNTGDLSLNGADLVDDLVAAHRRHDVIGVAWRAIPGNHDIGDDQAIARTQPVNAERLARWRSVFGADRWVMDAPGWRLLAINSLVIDSDLPDADAQAAFVAEALAGLDGRALLLALHKPLFDHGPGDEEVGGHFLNPSPRRRLMEALGPVRPRLVLNGHLHEHRERTVDGMHMVWGPGTSFVVPDFMFPPYGGRRTVGYVSVSLAPDGGFSTALVEVPGAVVNDLADFPGAYGDLRARHAASAAQ